MPAIAGHGVGILSPPMFKPAINAGLLVQPFAHAPLYKNSFWLVYPEHKRNLPKIRALRDWLLAAVRQDIDGTPAPLRRAPHSPTDGRR